MAKIQIIVGTVMGTAQGVAEHIQKTFSDQHEIEVNLTPGVDDLTRDENEFLLFVTSNTGSGDLPENIAGLYVALTTEFPRIAYRKYALINLGDSSYPTFGQAGETLDAALQDIGAERVGEPLLIDAIAERYPQKSAAEWLKSILEALD